MMHGQQNVQYTVTPASNFVGLKTPITVFHHDSAAIFPIAVSSSFRFGSLGCFAYYTKNQMFSAFSTERNLRGPCSESYSVALSA